MKKMILALLFLFSVSGLALEVEIKDGHKVIVSTKDISEVNPTEKADGGWDVSFRLNPKSTKEFADQTEKLKGKKLDIILDKEVISSPIVKATITSGIISIGANYSKEEAVDIASKISKKLKFPDATTEECNEKLRVQIINAAKEKCASKYQDLFWSEKELDVSADGNTISAGFSFKCQGGKRYLGLIKTSVPPNCEVSKAEISHTSIVPVKSLVK